jgi:hypothetical protein
MVALGMDLRMRKARQNGALSPQEQAALVQVYRTIRQMALLGVYSDQ